MGVVIFYTKNHAQGVNHLPSGDGTGVVLGGQLDVTS